MLLAGGEGRRLGALTKKKAKPAVHFGGYARMIDFALSNCTNSQISTIGVVTQYQPEALHRHIGSGADWLMDDKGEVVLLPSGQAQTGREGYTGTADAVYRNWPFIERHNPDYVLVLSGDHIYNMDYRKLIQYHRMTGADATIAVTPVDWSETGRFGIINIDREGWITEFEEKPEAAQSNLASMGIYIFNREFLRKFLEEDAVNEASSRDFGKDIIPAMLDSGAQLRSYAFKGYWKDVGTIDSLWEAHMDLLGRKPKFACNPANWPLHTSTEGLALAFKEGRGHEGASAAAVSVHSSIICRGSMVQGTVERSIISAGAVTGQGSRVYDSIVMPGAQIGSGVTVHRAIIGEGAVLRDGVTVGHPNSETITVVGDQEIVFVKSEKLPKIYIPMNQIPAGQTG
ncbi:MAG: glgC [Paenibacillus sp.]|jgi:glucose-1-phosphate adenylyltransferase|nr:glgC [Paenibacillus sp.]